MVLLAFSIQGEVEKYGAYVGIAAFLGLAVLTLLYFSQAREVKRLREWAGRAPERAAEIEALAVANAEAARREQETATAAAEAEAEPEAVPAANGAPNRQLRPEEIAAAAFARAAGAAVAAGPAGPEPPPPSPTAEHGAVAASAAAEEAAAEPAAEEPADDDPTAPTVPSPAPAPNGHRDETPSIPPAATPAARRGAPRAPATTERRPAPPLAVASRRPAAANPPDRSRFSVPTLAALLGVGVLVIAAAVFAATQLLGGGGTSHTAAPTPTAAAHAGTTATAARGARALKPADTHVAVLNSTPIPGLAASTRDQLTGKGYGKANLSTGNFSGPQRQQSVVLFRRGARRAGIAVARVLGIPAVQAVDPATQAQAQGKGPAPDVIVVVGGDKSR